MKTKNAFAQGKDAWKSTLQTSSQHKTKNVHSNQNEPSSSTKNNHHMSGEELLKKALTPKRK